MKCSRACARSAMCKSGSVHRVWHIREDSAQRFRIVALGAVPSLEPQAMEGQEMKRHLRSLSVQALRGRDRQSMRQRERAHSPRHHDPLPAR